MVRVGTKKKGVGGDSVYQGVETPGMEHLDSSGGSGNHHDRLMNRCICIRLSCGLDKVVRKPALFACCVYMSGEDSFAPKID